MQAPWHSVSRCFWHWQNLRISCLKILLANSLSQHQDLHQRVQYILSFYNSLPRALRRLTIFASAYALLEISIWRFCHRVISYKQLKRWKFWLVIFDRLIKTIHYELVKVIIDTSCLTKIIINMVVRHYALLNSIVSNQDSVFISKF